MEMLATFGLVCFMILNFMFKGKGGQVTTLGIYFLDMLQEGIKEAQGNTAPTHPAQPVIPTSLAKDKPPINGDNKPVDSL